MIGRCVSCYVDELASRWDSLGCNSWVGTSVGKWVHHWVGVNISWKVGMSEGRWVHQWLCGCIVGRLVRREGGDGSKPVLLVLYGRGGNKSDSGNPSSMFRTRGGTAVVQCS